MTVMKVMLHHANLADAGITAPRKPGLKCPAKRWSYNSCVQMGERYLLEDRSSLGNRSHCKSTQTSHP